MTTYHSIRRNAPLPVRVFTKHSSNLQELLLRRHGMTPYPKYATRVKNTYGDGIFYDRSTLTARSIGISEAYFRRRHPMVERYWRWEASTPLMRTDSGNTWCSGKCFHGQRPTQYGKPSMMIMMTTMTTMTCKTFQCTRIIDGASSPTRWRIYDWC